MVKIILSPNAQVKGCDEKAPASLRGLLSGWVVKRWVGSDV